MVERMCCIHKVVGSSPIISIFICKYIKMILKLLIKAGIFVGYLREKENTNYKIYLCARRQGIGIIDLNWTLLFIRYITEVLVYVWMKNLKILFIADDSRWPQAIEGYANKLEQYSISHKIPKSIVSNYNQFYNFEVILNQKQARTTTTAINIRGLFSFPDLIFLLNSKEYDYLLFQSNKLKIPTLTIIDSGISPNGIPYPIPGNDRTITSVFMLLYTIFILTRKINKQVWKKNILKKQKKSPFDGKLVWKGKVE